MQRSTAHTIIAWFTGGCIGVGVATTVIAATVGVPMLFSIVLGTTLLLSWLAVGLVWLLYG